MNWHVFRKLYDALLQVLEACGQEVSALRIRQQPPPAPPAAPPPATARAQHPPQPGPLQQQNQATGCQAAPARSRASEGGRENEGPDKRRRVVQVTPQTLNKVPADVDSTGNCAS